jgi:hypothetical protein
MDIKAMAVYDSSSSLKRFIWNNITKHVFTAGEQQTTSPVLSDAGSSSLGTGGKSTPDSTHSNQQVHTLYFSQTLFGSLVLLYCVYFTYCNKLLLFNEVNRNPRKYHFIKLNVIKSTILIFEVPIVINCQVSNWLI